MEQNRKISMVSSDVDGTLLRSDGTISAHTVDVIHELQRRGILFTICSGRYPEHADALLRHFGIRCPVTGNNGATQWDAETDRVLSDHFMPADSARKAFEVAEGLGLSFIVFCRKYVAARHGAAPHSSQKIYGPILARDYHIVFDSGLDAVLHALDRPVNKFYFHYDTPEERRSLTEALRVIPGISITTSGASNVEIIPLGCDKGSGVSEMARLYGVDMSQVMAIGDYENDVPMLRAAGLGVAMGNAHADVRDEAACVTDTNDRDGVAKAIEKYVL